ncbi:MAG: glycosyltransferase family 4 protein [Candidatus Hydrothermarchaeota archaeon]|nr:glycosyltransferase family 4 protein [Candidatus Hydrothermarchaeota archaeon]
MRILQVCNHFYPCIGGVERYVEDLCRNLIKLGHESDVVCLNTCAHTNEKLLKREEYDGIRIFRIPYINFKIYKLAPNVLNFLKNYDIIHVHSLGFFSDFLALTKFMHRKPLILSTHGGIFHTKAFSFLKFVYFNFWCRIILKKFDKIIADSRSDEKLFSVIAPNAELIPNGIEVRDFKIQREAENNTLLYVGRISKNKRIDNLIETIAVLKDKMPDVKLYVIGEDWEGILKDLKNLAKERNVENNVIFIGKIDKREEIAEYYSKAKFFASASEYEGFGISVLEAMAAGCVVIVNDIEAFREFIKDRENGFIVDYSNKKAADIISELMHRDLTTIGGEARKTAEVYDWKNTVKKIEKLYNIVRR